MRRYTRSLSNIVASILLIAASLAAASILSYIVLNTTTKVRVSSLNTDLVEVSYEGLAVFDSILAPSIAYPACSPNTVYYVYRVAISVSFYGDRSAYISSIEVIDPNGYGACIASIYPENIPSIGSSKSIAMTIVIGSQNKLEKGSIAVKISAYDGLRTTELAVSL